MDLPLSRAALIAARASGRTFEFLPFWGHTPPSDGRVNESCLSQWFRCRFVVDGVTYTSAEQWMMAGKARLFGDAQTLEKILSVEEPARVKALGREVRGFDAGRWTAHAFDLVSRGNVEKFKQEAGLRAYLVSTGSAVLVEASPTDTVWGIGLGRESQFVSQPEQWRGSNLLGFALMAARAAL